MTPSQARQKTKLQAVMIDLSAQQQIEGYEKAKEISPRDIREEKA